MRLLFSFVLLGEFTNVVFEIRLGRVASVSKLLRWKQTRFDLQFPTFCDLRIG